MKKWLTPIRLISIFIIFGAVIFIGKLYIIQVLRHSEYVQIATKQYQKPGGFFDRGSIYFEDKEGNKISAATVKSGYILAVNPKLIIDAPDAYNKISAILPLDKTNFLARALKLNDTYEEIQKQIPTDVGDKIKALKIKGVILADQNTRFYPGGITASHVLGLVAYKGNDFSGRYGLEAEYDTVLQRTSENLYANFFVEIFSNIKSGITSGNNSEGDLVTTIEPNVQSAFENTLKKVQSQWSSEETSGIIMDPKTGEILAMASVPNFDPNNFSQITSVSVFTNPLVQRVREMGSIMKAVTMASGIDAGVVTASTTYNDKGSVTYDKKTIYNFDKKGRGVINMQRVLSESLNTGASFVMTKLGTTRFADYLRRFGLEEKTGIDLPSEADNLISYKKNPRTVQYATASFGQGIALTPVSTIRAMAVIANGGMLVKPHVVKEVDPIEGLKYDPSSSYVPVRVISADAAKQTTDMLVYIVDNNLQNGKAKNPHYAIAAKTGTAQMAAPGGGYYPDRFLHSFIGFFPAYNPKFVVLMYTVYPKGAGYAASTMAQPFLDLSKFLINYYSLPPDR
ncbi:MAG: penicillin-binding protein 2 [Candidatus Paceibacterota bacterium]